MNRVIKLFIPLLFLSAIFSCSSTRECKEKEDYLIEYSTGGGFTGLEKGLTIQCSGMVKFWEKKLNQNKSVTDSLSLKASQLEVLDAAIRDKSVFDFKMNRVGNYTALLFLKNFEKTNSIKFNPTDLPAEMPVRIKTILNEIEKINKAER